MKWFLTDLKTDEKKKFQAASYSGFNLFDRYFCLLFSSVFALRRVPADWKDTAGSDQADDCSWHLPSGPKKMAGTWMAADCSHSWLRGCLINHYFDFYIWRNIWYSDQIWGNWCWYSSPGGFFWPETQAESYGHTGFDVNFFSGW